MMRSTLEKGYKSSESQVKGYNEQNSWPTHQLLIHKIIYQASYNSNSNS